MNTAVVSGVFPEYQDEVDVPGYTEAPCVPSLFDLAASSDPGEVSP